MEKVQKPSNSVLHAECYPEFFPHNSPITYFKLLGTIGVDCKILDLLLTSCLVFIKYHIRNGDAKRERERVQATYRL
jgi:hypothetical protein